ncbi:hypothetical protein Tco_1576949 [Tanacetum coccineum]
MDTEIPQASGPTEHVIDEAVYKERGDSLVRASTTASILESEQDSGNIDKTQSMETLNEPSSLGTTSGGGPRCQETMGDTIAQTRFENVSRQSYDPRLARESSGDEESFDKDASKQGRIDAIDADDDITMVSFHDVNVSAGEEEVVEVINTAKLIIVAAQVSTVGAATTVSVATTTTAITVQEITLAQGLADLKSTKPKAKGIAFREPGESTTTTPPIPSKIQDKGKAKMIEPKPVKKLSKKYQLKLDEEIALKLQAEIDEEERIARAEEEKIDEVNID